MTNVQQIQSLILTIGRKLSDAHSYSSAVFGSSASSASTILIGLAQKLDRHRGTDAIDAEVVRTRAEQLRDLARPMTEVCRGVDGQTLPGDTVALRLAEVLADVEDAAAAIVRLASELIAEAEAQAAAAAEAQPEEQPQGDVPSAEPEAAADQPQANGLGAASTARVRAYTGAGSLTLAGSAAAERVSGEAEAPPPGGVEGGAIR